MQFDLKCFLSSVAFLIAGLLIVAGVEVTRHLWVDATIAVVMLVLAAIGFWAAQSNQQEWSKKQSFEVTELRCNPDIHAGIIKIREDSLLDL